MGDESSETCSGRVGGRAGKVDLPIVHIYHAQKKKWKKKKEKTKCRKADLGGDIAKTWFLSGGWMAARHGSKLQQRVGWTRDAHSERFHFRDRSKMASLNGFHPCLRLKGRDTQLLPSMPGPFASV